MRVLHGELAAMQEWVKSPGAKICIVFEAGMPPAREARSSGSPNGCVAGMPERVDTERLAAFRSADREPPREPHVVRSPRPRRPGALAYAARHTAHPGRTRPWPCGEARLCEQSVRPST